MIITSAYHTAALNGYSPERYINEMKKFIAVAGEKVHLIDNNTPKKAFIDASAKEVAAVVTSFNHPLSMPDNTVFADIRPHTRVDMRTRQVITSNPSEVRFAFARTELEYALNQGAANHMLTFSALPINVYASWLSENLTRRFMLDMGGQYRLTILAAIYYICLLDTKDEWNEQDRQVIARQIVEDLRVRAEDVFEVLDKMDKPFVSLNDFCSRTAVLMENVRMQDFNAALVFTILGGTWVGHNAREVACVAIEHIPTFLAMIKMSVEERGFNSSSFSKLVQRKGKRELEMFTTKLTGITVSYG